MKFYDLVLFIFVFNLILSLLASVGAFGMDITMDQNMAGKMASSMNLDQIQKAQEDVTTSTEEFNGLLSEYNEAVENQRDNVSKWQEKQNYLLTNKAVIIADKGINFYNSEQDKANQEAMTLKRTEIVLKDQKKVLEGKKAELEKKQADLSDMEESFNIEGEGGGSIIGSARLFFSSLVQAFLVFPFLNKLGFPVNLTIVFSSIMYLVYAAGFIQFITGRSFKAIE